MDTQLHHTEVAEVAAPDSLRIDLSDLVLEDIEILNQQGATGMPGFAASSGHTCIEAGSSSCSCQSL
jgi:hypothetical protein